MKNLIHAYGVLASPLQLSAALTQLRISHVAIDNSLRAVPSVKDVAIKQPAWPVVMPSLQAFKRYRLDYPRQIVLVCGSLAELRATNLKVVRDWQDNLPTALKHALVDVFDPDWQLVINEMAVEAYVDIATKPSFLNHVQAELYKLTPYDLRKEVQALVIAYLAGIESKAKLQKKLASSYKLDRLKALMSDPKCQVLRNAVAEYRKIEDEAVVAKVFGVETFEIMYLVKSSDKKSI